MSVSRTAQYVALYRALESCERRRPRLFEDRFAEGFLSPRYRLLLKAAHVPVLHDWISRYADRRAPGARTNAIARTRLIDDVARRCAEQGVRQLVLLGAGFDCRAHRLPELSDSTVFEVDRAGTQSVKRALLGQAPGAARVRYVPIDFLRDDVATALAGAGWRSAQPTLFVWEGVTNYLTESAVAGVLSWIGGTAEGSTLVMTYVHTGLLDGTITFEGGDRILENVRRLGEPWTFGLRPEEVAGFLARFGLELLEDVGADDYRRRYGLADDARRRGYAFYRLAVATRPAAGRAERPDS